MIAWLKLFGFVLTSLALIAVSRGSLRGFRSHGLFRLFAWVLIAGLVFQNLDHWFANPFSWYQLISWGLLALSIFLAVHGFRLLRQIGRPDPSRTDEGLIGIEKTTQLVTVGAYRFIRHPLYTALLCLAWGTFFKAPGWLAVLLALAASACLTLTAKAEEDENRRYFGPAYQAYQEHTKMFIPLVF